MTGNNSLRITNDLTAASDGFSAVNSESTTSGKSFPGVRHLRTSWRRGSRQLGLLCADERRASLVCLMINSFRRAKQKNWGYHIG